MFRWHWNNLGIIYCAPIIFLAFLIFATILGYFPLFLIAWALSLFMPDWMAWVVAAMLIASIGMLLGTLVEIGGERSRKLEACLLFFMNKSWKEKQFSEPLPEKRPVRQIAKNLFALYITIICGMSLLALIWWMLRYW